MKPSQRASLSVTILGLACIAPGTAAEAPPGLLACRTIVDSTTRLACFDRESAALAPGPAAPASAALIPGATAAAPASASPSVSAAPPGKAPAPTPAAPALNPEQQFGLPERAVAAKEIAAGTRAADTSHIEAHLSGVAPGADGRLMFALDNGQVWRQLMPEGEMLAKSGDDVTISRGLLGSYWLQLKSGRGCKVTRLR